MNINYNAYTSIPKNATFKLRDMVYRRSQVLETSLPTETELGSFEYVPAARILYIIDLLQYFQSKHILEGTVLPKTEKHWFDLNEKRLTSFINSAEPKHSFYTPTGMYQYKTYSSVNYLKDFENEVNLEYLQQNSIDDQTFDKVGRLYNYFSLQALPRELRFLLFEGIYKDFDMVNSHPTILLDYAQSNKLELNGSLEFFVKERDNCLKQIEAELPASYLESLKNSNTSLKKNILKHLNRRWVYQPSGSSLHDKLDADFEALREYNWSLYEKGEKFSEFVTAIEGKGLSLGKKKCRLTSLYCQTLESKHVLALVSFLREHYKRHVLSEGKKHFCDYEPLTDKNVELSSVHTLSVIPFFDGFLCRSLDKNFHLKLPELVTTFNHSRVLRTHVRFVEKPILPDWKHLTGGDKKGINFIQINSWLRKPQNRSKINQYFEQDSVIAGYLDALFAIDRSSVTLLDEVDKFNTLIKTRFYASLLEQDKDFSTPEDVGKEVDLILAEKVAKIGNI